MFEAATEEPVTLGCPSLVPGAVVVHDEPGAPKAALDPLIKRCAKTPETIVMQTTLPSGRCLSAEWLAESSDHRTQAFLYDDDKMVCRITFFDGYQSRSIGFKITKQALRGLVSKAGRMARWRANKNAKKGGAA